MKITDFSKSEANGRARVSAMVSWEDCDQPKTEIYYETEASFSDDLICNPNAFLTAAIIPAMHYEERRIQVEGQVCPKLRNGLTTAIRHLSSWYGEERHRPVTIEPQKGFKPLLPREPRRTALFMSGGVDALASLRGNRLDFPLDHPESVKDCIFVHGIDLGATADMDKSYDHFDTSIESNRSLGKLADFTLIPVYTNISYLGNNYKIFTRESHGAVLASIAHAFSGRISKALIASSDCVEDLIPWGSHPLLDPNYSSADMHIEHDGVRLSRPEKASLLSEWDVGLQHLRSCYYPHRTHGELNCGRCEKCLRTMTELLICGKLREAKSFPLDDVTPEQIQTLVALPGTADGHCYTFLYEGNACFWKNLLEPLRKTGRYDLVEAIESKLAEYDKYRAFAEERDWKGAVKRFDRRFLNGLLFKLNQARKK